MRANTPIKGSVATGSTRSAAHSAAVATCPLRWPTRRRRGRRRRCRRPRRRLRRRVRPFVTPAVEWVRVWRHRRRIGGGRRPNVCACTGWCPCTRSARCPPRCPSTASRCARCRRQRRVGAVDEGDPSWRLEPDDCAHGRSAPLGRGRLDDGQLGDGGDHRCVCWAAAAGPAPPVSTVSIIAWSWVDTRE